MNKDEFQVLTDAQHLRLRPNMYIGSTSVEPLSGMFFGTYQTLNVVPGLLKIINEIIDNTIDEAIRTNFEYANKVSINISSEENLTGQEWIVSIEDNGRGIPVTPLGKSYRPVVAWTQARAGSNFSSERETLGANGVGSFATAVFSTEFIGETSDGSNYLKLDCGPLATIKKVTTKASTKNFTKVTFKPDLAEFHLETIDQDHINFIIDRIENLAAVYPQIHFTFNSEKIKVKSIKEYASKYCQHYVYTSDDSNSLIFGPSGESEEFRVHSYVNGLWIRNGGSHVNYVIDQVVSTLRTHIKKKHKIDVLPNQIKQHLTFVSILRGFWNLRFDSQTKERITNTSAEVADHLKNIDFDKISKQILNTPEILDPMIAAILYKKEMAEKLALQKKQKSMTKVRVVNHIAATDPDIEKRILFLAEGLSAIGSLIAVRNPKIHGGYPLRGKVMNVRGMKPVDIIKNKEISELMSIIGLEFNSKPTLNYGKICIMTDQDQDGSAIFALLLNLFSNWPSLFSEGRIYRLMTPLYSAQKGKIVKMFYSKEEYEKLSNNLKGYEISYNKGLGTLTKETYSECINDPYFIKITDLNEPKLNMAFGDDANLRKEWMLA